MREINFRAWDGEKMHEWDSIDHGAVDVITGTPYPRLFYLPMSWLVGDSNDWKWMQYTGLKDKNGKEIYEGDVLYYGTQNKGKVIFENACFKIVWQYPDPELISILHGDYFEIIGNIYENPELIK